MLIYDASVFFEKFDGNVAKACRRRNGEALLHVLDDLLRDAGERFSDRVRGDCGRWGFWRRRCGARLLRGCRRRWFLLIFLRLYASAITREQIAEIGLPGLVNRFWIRLKTSE